jgi:hypothetical protein
VSEIVFDDRRRGQLRQRVRVLRVLVVSRCDVAGGVAEQLADLELRIRHAHRIVGDPQRWLRALDETIAAVDTGTATGAELSRIIGTIAATLRDRG